MEASPDKSDPDKNGSGFCSECNRPLPPFSDETSQVCGRVECKVAERRRQLFGEEAYDRHRAVCAEVEEEQQSSKSIREIDEQQNRDLWKLAVGKNSAYELSHLPLTVIPTGPTKTVNLPPSRKQQYKQNLARVIREAFTEAPETEMIGSLEQCEESATDEAMIGQFCGECRGGCCVGGDDHAYVVLETIQRYRLQNPDASGDEILDAYLEHAPDESVENSCINHGPGGCSLPRDMRSLTCNQYLCPGVKAWCQDYADNPSVLGSYVVRRRLDKRSLPQAKGEDRVMATYFKLKPSEERG